jgi:cell wall-associated NlpC family hydrolase
MTLSFPGGSKQDRVLLVARRHWAGVLAIALAGCASPPGPSPSSPSAAHAPFAPAGPPAQTPSTPYDPKRNDLALFALSLLDTRYASGGKGPATGFDCSGLVSHVYRSAVGITVKGSAADLARQSRPIEREPLPGDLVFFNTLGPRNSHVGVYVGQGRFVHASNPRTGVRMDRLSNPYYAQRFEGAQSLLD